MTKATLTDAEIIEQYKAGKSMKEIRASVQRIRRVLVASNTPIRPSGHHGHRKPRQAITPIPMPPELYAVARPTSRLRRKLNERAVAARLREAA